MVVGEGADVCHGHHSRIAHRGGRHCGEVRDREDAAPIVTVQGIEHVELNGIQARDARLVGEAAAHGIGQ